MGNRGPKPKLVAMRLLEGNPSKRAMPPAGIDAMGEPFIPPDLSDDAQECIEKIKELMPPGIYGAIDGFALSAYATAYAWHKFFRHEMTSPDFEPLVIGSTGQQKAHPYFKLIKDQSSIMMSWGDRLGLDPKARQAIAGAGNGAQKPASKFGSLVGGAA